MYRSRTGGDEWEPLTTGLPQANCYVNVLRDAMAVDTLDDCGIYFGTTGGQVYGSADGGDTWAADRAGPARGALGGSPGAAVIRVVLPAHLKNLARVSGEVRLELTEPVDPAAGAGRPGGRSIRCCAAPSGTSSTGQRRAFIRFYACEEDLSNEPPDAPLPDRVVDGEEPFLVIGAMAGG